MTEPAAPASGFERLVVRQKLTLMVNRYEIIRSDETGALLDVIAFAEQKRMAFKEQVTFFTDSGKQHPVFGFTARKRLDLGSGYDVTDAFGTPIGWFKKEFGASLLNSTWRLAEVGGPEVVGRERNQKVAIARRVWDLIPVVGEIAVPFLFHFDFRGADGAVVLSSTRKVGMKDVYHLEMPAGADGRRLDWRLGAAMGVALDALQGR